MVLLRRETGEDSTAQQNLQSASDQASDQVIDTLKEFTQASDQVTASELEQLRVGSVANATTEEIQARQRLDDLQRQVEVAAVELGAAKHKLAVAKGQVNVTPFGHIVPPQWGHWKWNDQFNAMMFESNNGWSQARLDPPGTVKVGLGSSKAMVDAVDVTPGTRIDFDEDSVNNEKDLRDAAYYNGGRWIWGRDKQVSRVHEIPHYDYQVGDGINPITKYYHALWKNEKTHLKSAYEPDFFRDNSEFFGPFRLDYDTNTIWLTDWNLHLAAINPISSGRGNMLVGPNHFYAFATNSFASGKENSLRGEAQVVLGGKANQAKDYASTVVGGEGNAAKRTASSIAGGFHNEVIADYGHISGGMRNRIEKEGGSILGGATNLIQAKESTILAGDGNKITGELAAIHGGMGNKALSPLSTINGGEGGKTTKKYEILTGVMPLEDVQTEEKMEAMEAESHATGGAPVPANH